jgi:predicted nucleic acid-binding protein
MSDVDRYFVDTNVFVYTYDRNDTAKSDRAEAWVQWLWERAACSVSWQVIQELYWNAVQKFHAPAEKIREHVAFLAELEPPDVTLGLLERAWFWTDRAGISFWDALIVSAAERCECRYLLSEDFQAGRQFGSVEVVNPFETTPPASPAAL